ncbi:3-dehydroquinate synthase [Candidatus Nanopelagicus limnes]|jgi:3-dehydroquinate synthase|uniref:3-dehydroquinate synthase n=1 Tax=Candidatus Nanopelagicus limnae TaxID=1884634 RepID=A0A249JXT7_9ACTN|nr:3-dehydroquinate synthase [Candidatus Nanopelagicus limnes]ASY09331.1 3-dehydroquinate synthase [Candidatus Nanopelagicus limnes]
MKIINVKGEHRYPVKVGVNWTNEVKAISSIHNKVLIIAPKSIVSKYKLKESSGVKFFTTPEGENQKNINVLDKVWSKCAAEGIARADAIIGIGGGATTDLAGFAASSWLRGISWYAIPTSLAGMVDAAVGGKTGINARSGKNLIGSFYSPTEVLIDLAFLNTLPKRDLSAGMAEVLKCGFIADYKILNLAQDDDLDYQQLITRAIKVKADVVSKDFKESKLREILNYGHTLGHAIEKNSGYKLRHGEAVSIGMVFAAELSRKLSGLSDDAVLLHRELLRNFDLPISYPINKFKPLLALLAKDKKVRNSKLRFIGISKIGKPVWFDDVSPSTLSKVYERIAK